MQRVKKNQTIMKKRRNNITKSYKKKREKPARGIWHLPGKLWVSGRWGVSAGGMTGRSEVTGRRPPLVERPELLWARGRGKRGRGWRVPGVMNRVVRGLSLGMCGRGGGSGANWGGAVPVRIQARRGLVVGTASAGKRAWEASAKGGTRAYALGHGH